MTTAQIIVTVCFVFVMICNVITLVRHWRMMRVMNIMLTGLAETQKEFNDIMAEEQKTRRVDKLLQPGNPNISGMS